MPDRTSAALRPEAPEDGTEVDLEARLARAERELLQLQALVHRLTDEVGIWNPYPETPEVEELVAVILVESFARRDLGAAAFTTDEKEARSLRARAGNLRRRNRETVDWLEGSRHDVAPLRAVMAASR